jgi:hypothetical protein
VSLSYTSAILFSKVRHSPSQPKTIKVNLSSLPTMYKILRSILFLFPPEWTHYFSMNCLKVLCFLSPIRSLIAWIFTSHVSRLTTNILNLEFRNPIGLGAGFDKNAKYFEGTGNTGVWICRNRNHHAIAPGRKSIPKIISPPKRQSPH